MSEFQCVLKANARLGESPVWLADEGLVMFVDIKGRKIHRFNPSTGACDSFETAEDVGCVAATEDGLIVAAMRSAIFLLNTDGTIVRKLANNPEDQSISRFNDGRCDRTGRLWVGTIDESKAVGDAKLYRLDEDGLTPMVGGLMTSNGLGFSPSDMFLYHSDTPRHAIYRYPLDLEDGVLEGRDLFKQFVPTETDKGRPDGAAVDAEGCYWSALWEGARVQRYAPDGKLLAEYPVPAKCVTMPCFGGPDLKTLYVTTARDGRPEDELAHYPDAGGLFAMTVDVPGLPEPRFSRFPAS